MAGLLLPDRSGRRERPGLTSGPRAVRDGRRLIVLNGTKNFTTNGGFADVIIAFFSTDREKGAKGISAFLVPKETRPDSRSASTRTSWASAPPARRRWSSPTAGSRPEPCSARRTSGLSIALATFDCGRIGIAAQAVGIAEAALDEAVKYSKERIQFGKPIAEFQALQFMLADMAVDVEVAKTMLYRVAWMKDSGAKRFTKESAMVKLFASEMAHRVCHKALQIHGGYGFMKDYKIERLYRDQRITEIYEGTSEIQRLVIARVAPDRNEEESHDRTKS